MGGERMDDFLCKREFLNFKGNDYVNPLKDQGFFSFVWDHPWGVGGGEFSIHFFEMRGDPFSAGKKPHGQVAKGMAGHGGGWRGHACWSRNRGAVEQGFFRDGREVFEKNKIKKLREEDSRGWIFSFFEEEGKRKKKRDSLERRRGGQRRWEQRKGHF